MRPKKLGGLNPREYEHPYDAQALDALQKVPALDRLVRAYNTYWLETPSTIQYTGSNLRITADTYPTIHAAFASVCDTVNLPTRPDFYLKADYEVNGMTCGIDHPIIVLTSGAIDYLDDRELDFLIGHEVGHIKSRHVLYRQMAVEITSVMLNINAMTFGFGKLVTQSLVASLFWWYRMSELTADRAGLLACQDVDAVIRVMMKFAGLPRKYYKKVHRQSFIEQASQFQDLDYDLLSKAWKVRIAWTSPMTHPWTVLRAAELMKWVESGEYQAVLDRKSTVSDKPSVTAAAAVCCHQCGGPLAGTESFCPACGQRVGTTDAT